VPVPLPGAPVKLVTAVIKPFKLDEVRAALTTIGVPHMTVTEVQGYGRQKGHSALYRGAEYAAEFLPKVKLELAVRDEVLDQVLDAILDAAHTGNVGDGKIFVLELQQAIRIRTRETESDALR
jgi:nitrogen regulatory protein P-II 2